MVHKGEEPPLTGSHGSGTVFFAHCTLSCCYCQNFPFSQQHNGKEVSVHELASAYLWLQEQGCHNINWVSPTQYFPFAISALIEAREKGLHIPIVWNSSGWEKPSIVEVSRYFCDIYLFDMRYSVKQTGELYSSAIDYPTINRQCITVARNNQPEDIWDGELLQKGILLRFLVLPGFSQECIENLQYIHDTLGPSTLVSVMSQYFPTWKATSIPPLNRKITSQEWNTVKKTVENLHFSNGWIQDYEP